VPVAPSAIRQADEVVRHFQAALERR